MNTGLVVAAALLAVGGYLLGAIPFGLLIGRSLYGVDVRRAGSGNVGTTNVLRVLGKRAALMVLICDVLKGFAPALAAGLLFEPWLAITIGVMPVVGHMRSIFLRGGGGKGVATGAGMVLALMWPVFLIALGVWLVVLLGTRIMSLASLSAAVSFAAGAWLLHEPLAYRVAALVISFGVILAHHGNIRRLLAGEEPRLSMARSGGGTSSRSGRRRGQKEAS